MASAAQQQDAKAPACLLLLCGLPAAGKTTLARALAQRAHMDGASCGVRVAHVCFDDYQQAGGGFEPAAWKVRALEAAHQILHITRELMQHSETCLHVQTEHSEI
jgi:predicted ATPase